jgi:hypothetical protein
MAEKDVAALERAIRHCVWTLQRDQDRA